MLLVLKAGSEAAGGGKVSSLACGARHVAALTDAGVLLTWGIGGQGQLGRLDAFDQATATELQPTAAQLFTATAVDGLAAVFGGGLGDGTAASAVAGVSCGSYSTFAVSGDGRVAAWGLNNSGQLGLAKAGDDDNIRWCPALVPSMADVAKVAGGEAHTLVLRRDGTLLSCGAATYGMLGRQGVDVGSTSTIFPDPALVDGLDGVQVVGCAAGTNVSACCTADGGLYLWGSNVNYQLAKGDNETDGLLPEKMKRAKTFGYRKVLEVVFGGQHAALLAGKADDEAPVPEHVPAQDAPVPVPEVPVPVPEVPVPEAAAPAPEAAAAAASEAAAATAAAAASEAEAAAAPEQGLIQEPPADVEMDGPE